jgi:hypothetical protein
MSVKSDRARESGETFTVERSDAVGAAIDDAVGVGTIVGDDGTSPREGQGRRSDRRPHHEGRSARQRRDAARPSRGNGGFTDARRRRSRGGSLR